MPNCCWAARGEGDGTEDVLFIHLADVPPLPLFLFPIFSCMSGSLTHSFVLAFFLSFMYLEGSSFFVTETFFFFYGSVTVDLKPDEYRLTWRARGERRSPGFSAVDRLPQVVLKRTDRRSAALRSPLAWLCCVY